MRWYPRKWKYLDEKFSWQWNSKKLRRTWSNFSKFLNIAKREKGTFVSTLLECNPAPYMPETECTPLPHPPPPPGLVRPACCDVTSETLFNLRLGLERGRTVLYTEVEFLDINLTKDSSFFFLHAIRRPLYWRILQNTILKTKNRASGDSSLCSETWKCRSRIPSQHKENQR